MSSNLAPGDFANPNSVVGAYSASEAATNTTPNFEAVPDRFSNNLVYSGSNTYGGTSSNIQAAKGKFVRLTGGSSRIKRGGDPTGSSNHETTGSTGEPENITMHNDENQALNEYGEPCRLCALGDESDNIDPTQLCAECRRDVNLMGGGRKLITCNSKMNGGNKLGMDVKNPSTSVGTIGAGHPGHMVVDHSGVKSNLPANKVAPSPLEGGKGRKRRRTRNKRSRKMKKTKSKGKRKSKGRKRKTRGRKVNKKRRTRKVKKMRGGGCGCNGTAVLSGGYKKKRSLKIHKRSKKRGAGSCGSKSKKNHMHGGSPQPFSNEPLSFGFSFDGSPLNPNESALASPMPHKSYFGCEKVARN